MTLKLFRIAKRLENFKSSSSQSFLSTLSETKEDSENIRTIKKKPTKTSQSPEFKPSKDIKDYLDTENINHILKILPEKYLKKKQRTPESFYLVNQTTARAIADRIQKIRTSKTILEVNPGLGILTKELLKMNTIQNLNLYEADDYFIPQLENLVAAETKKDIIIKKGDFIGMWKIGYQDKLDNGNRMISFLEGVPKKNWSDDAPNITVVANLGSVNFMKSLINSIIFQNGLISFGRPELFLVMPPPLYIHLTCSNDLSYLFYRSTTILFQILFEHEFIGNLPREDFFPWQTEYYFSKRKLKKINSIDVNYMYLTRIRPRKNLFDLCAPENLISLWYFIKQNCISRKTRVIPNLEKMIPGCGPRLITISNRKSKIAKECAGERKNIPKFSIPTREMSITDHYPEYNIFTEFGDLTPSQILSLFNTFINWPEYNECPFKASMESAILKMETSIDSSSDGLDIPDEDDHTQIEREGIVDEHFKDMLIENDKKT